VFADYSARNSPNYGFHQTAHRSTGDSPAGLSCNQFTESLLLNPYILLSKKLRQFPIHIGRISVRLQPHHRPSQLLLDELAAFHVSGNDYSIDVMLLTNEGNLAHIEGFPHLVPKQFKLIREL